MCDMNRFSKLVMFCSLFVLASCRMGQNDNLRVFNIVDYGAEADGVSDNARAIQKTIDACVKAGGGQVLVPAGVYMAGPFEVGSYVDLHLEANARIVANPDEKVYVKSAFRENRGEGMMWISGDSIEQFSISGKGTLDGNGVCFMGKELDDSYELKAVHESDPRPHLLTLIAGKGIRIEHVNIINSAYWAVHLVGCDDVVINGITLLNNLKIRNGDGIDVDHSKNVRISNCYIESGDDCICLKNRREYEEYGPCENIAVVNCVMTSRSCAIKIGSENMDRISHVVIDNCVIKDSNRGIGIQNRDEGTVEHVIFSNILIDSHLYSDVWWGKSEPIYVTAYPRKAGDHKDAGWRFPKGVASASLGTVSDIYFSNIKCDSENGVFVGGESADKIQRIYFDQVDLLISKKTQFQGGVYDKRPCEGEDFVTGKTFGFYLDAASDVTIRNSSVSWGDTRPAYFADIIESRGVTGLTVTNLTGKPAR